MHDVGVSLHKHEVADFYGAEVADAANADRQRLLESERAARSEAERANYMKDEFWLPLVTNFELR